MNIFYLDPDPAIAAKMQCDKHVVKMILESAQLLCTAHNVLDGPNDWAYSSTHINHPCAKWVRDSALHYDWLYRHYIALMDEYTTRYKKMHKCSEMAARLLLLPKCIPHVGFTDPPQCMPDEDKCIDTDEAYIRYYNRKFNAWNGMAFDRVYLSDWSDVMKYWESEVWI